MVKLPKIESAEGITSELETAISNISAAMKALKAGKLKEDALVILLQAQTGINKTTIKSVLYGISNMEKAWLKEPL